MRTDPDQQHWLSVYMSSQADPERFDSDSDSDPDLNFHLNSVTISNSYKNTYTAWLKKTAYSHLKVNSPQGQKGKKSKLGKSAPAPAN